MTSSYLGAVFLVISRAHIDAFVKALHHALHVSGHVAGVLVSTITEFAKLVGSAAVVSGINCVVGGRAIAIAEQCWLGLYVGSGGGGGQWLADRKPHGRCVCVFGRARLRGAAGRGGRTLPGSTQRSTIDYG